MKKLILFVFVLISLTTVQSQTMTDNNGDGYFYTALAPYGEWFELSDGITVWRPVMMPRNWEPYTIGNWEWTDDGWYWNSDEPFGYITYHYGRWYNDDYYGWIWVPDDQWAPAWVDWRYDDDYVGWAPLSPYGEFREGYGIFFTQEYHAHYRYWNFVAYNHFCDANVYHYYAGPTYKNRIYNGTKFRNDYDYNNGRVINRGIGYDLVRERSGLPIRTTEIVRTTDPKVVRDNKDKNIITTYTASRNDLSRNNLRDITVKKQDRKTTMDITKVTLGDRNNVSRNGIDKQRQTPVVKGNTEIQKRDILEQQNRQKQQQTDQLNQQRNQDVQRQQQIDLQNRQKQLDVQRQQQVDQQNRQKQLLDQQNRQNQQNLQRQQVQQRQSLDQQNRQRQQVQQRQTNDQQNIQRQQVQQRQQADQQNRQRQQVQQKQQADQQNRQRQQVEQKRQQTEQRNETRDNGKDRR
jgi:hypothetical protein